MPDPVKLGKYEIRGRLGAGATAVVFEALDPTLGRTVALKAVDRSKLDPADARIILERFLREAQAVGRLHHPGIVDVYEYGQDGDYVFIAMEMVRGRSLAAVLAETPRPDPRWCREVVKSVLLALAYSHGRGVIHRDIKPANILITSDGAVKLTDFGIARVDSSNLTQRGDMLGTPSYMSAEQYLGEQSDARTDIYATGVILYEVLTGRRPFVGQSSGEVMQRVLYETPVNPTELNPQLPPAVDWLLQKALAKQPEDRFETAMEFRQAIDEALPDEQLAALGPQVPASTAGLPGSTAARPAAGLIASARKLSAARGQAPEQTLQLGAAAAAGVRQAATGGVPKPSILLVDDEERILSALRSIFRFQYDVVTAGSGQEGLVQVRQQFFPLIVSDQRMPGMLGVEFLRQVREISPASVRVLLTGYSDLASIVGSINEGEVFRFVSKPWNNQELMQLVEEAVAIGTRLKGTPMAPPAKSAPAKRKEHVLVLDPGTDALAMLQRQVGAQVPLLHARAISDVVGKMQDAEVAVVVADTDRAFDNHMVFFNLLKREYPQILVIVLTGASDSEHVIELINDAQVYRFLPKPVDARLLGVYVHAALARYDEYRSRPQMLEQHVVHESPKVRQSTGEPQGWMERLRQLRARLTSSPQ